MNLRQAAQQALEALEATCPENPHSQEARAITALRAALAEPEQKPVAYLWQHCETGRTRIVMPDQIITTDATWLVVGPLYLHPPQRTEPEQEPVAWIEHGLIEAPDGLVWERGTVGHYTPLYTRPAPQPVTLTDEEVDRAIERHAGGHDLSDAEYRSMAKEAGYVAAWQTPEEVERLEHFAALVAAAAVRETSAEYRLGWNDGAMMEREACAKVADDMTLPDWANEQIATAIRARGQE